MSALSPGRRRQIFLVLCAATLLPLCFLGYGSDNDTFTVLESGRLTWLFHAPVTSRNPGYWTFEAIVYALSGLGGYLATNVATLGIALLLLVRFLVLAARLGVRFPLLVAASLAATPVFAIAATSTDDYLWSLLGIVLFAELLLADRLLLAVFPAALAFAIRGANGIVIAGAISGAITASLLQQAHNDQEPDARPPHATPAIWRLVAVGLAAMLLGGLPYVASYRAAHHTLRFLHPLSGSAEMWTIKLRLGRFFLKTVNLFGPLACLFVGASVLARRVARATSSYARRATPVWLGIIVANAALFLVWPIEISYLLPAAFFSLLLLGATLLGTRRALAIAFFLAVLSLDFVNPQLFRPNIAGHATAAIFRPGIERGVLLQDIRSRLALRSCSDYFCFYRVTHPESPELIYSGPRLPSPPTR